MKLIYEKSRPGRRAGTLANPGLPVPELPEELRRSMPPRLPEISEPELVRHFTALSTRNFGIDTGFYPLGSCTMKYNPRVNERLVGLPGFRDVHPLQDEDGAQGALELMWRLQEILAEVAGLRAVSLQPAAGSQGELTGLLLMRAYFDEKGELERRRKVVIPDTAHGTNPASVTMAGFEVLPVATDARGNVDVEDLRAKVDETTAGLMLTNPSTLGLFDESIEEIARIFHGAGALMYYDGANLNAVCGISRPGDMGFDIVHYNLHKTFSQPHGGGGPGGGPIAVRETLEAYLPVPAVIRDGERFRLDFDRPKSIGKVRGFTGPFGVFVRSYAFIRMWGPRLREMSEVAVLNANYLLARHPRPLRAAVRPALHARVRRVGAAPQAGTRRHGARRGQAAHGPRLPSAHDLLPARRPRGAHDRADGDRGEGDARRLRGRDDRDRARGGGVAGAAEGGAARPAGRAPGRGEGCKARRGALPLRRSPRPLGHPVAGAAAARGAEGRLTRCLGAAVAALLVAVAVDAFAGGGGGGGDDGAGTVESPPGARATPRSQVSAALRSLGLRGTLVYTDRDCRLHALRLPSLAEIRAPADESVDCSFELSADGRRVAPAGAAWNASEEYAICNRAYVELRTSTARRTAAHRPRVRSRVAPRIAADPHARSRR